jgi:hypothetical protein
MCELRFARLFHPIFHYFSTFLRVNFQILEILRVNANASHYAAFPDFQISGNSFA